MSLAFVLGFDLANAAPNSDLDSDFGFDITGLDLGGGDVVSNSDTRSLKENNQKRTL